MLSGVAAAQATAMVASLALPAAARWSQV